MCPSAYWTQNNGKWWVLFSAECNKNEGYLLQNSTTFSKHGYQAGTQSLRKDSEQWLSGPAKLEKPHIESDCVLQALSSHVPECVHFGHFIQSMAWGKIVHAVLQHRELDVLSAGTLGIKSWSDCTESGIVRKPGLVVSGWRGRLEQSAVRSCYKTLGPAQIVLQGESIGS